MQINYLYGIQKLVGDEMVFFYMTEVEKKVCFSHEFGVHKESYTDLDGYLQVDSSDYKNPELIEEYFEKHYSELEREILRNYELGLLIKKRAI